MRVEYLPMPGKIAVKVEEANVYEKIILLSDPANSRLGRVVAVYEPFLVDGDETEAYVQVGDLVVFGRHNGVQVVVGRERTTILKEAEILTKVKLIREDTDPEETP